jgi:hypothetical protein
MPLASSVQAGAGLFRTSRTEIGAHALRATVATNVARRIVRHSRWRMIQALWPRAGRPTLRQHNVLCSVFAFLTVQNYPGGPSDPNRYGTYRAAVLASIATTSSVVFTSAKTRAMVLSSAWCVSRLRTNRRGAFYVFVTDIPCGKCCVAVATSSHGCIASSQIDKVGGGKSGSAKLPTVMP